MLKDSARGSSGGARGTNFRAGLIVAEVALSAVVLVGSSLLLLSFLKLQRTPPGFNPKGVATAFVGVPATRYKTNPEQTQFFETVIDRLKSVPQVRGALAAGVARLGQTLLFNVQPLDPPIYGGVTVLFAVVAAPACLLPSLRASRIDPLVALRAE